MLLPPARNNTAFHLPRRQCIPGITPYTNLNTLPENIHFTYPRTVPALRRNDWKKKKSQYSLQYNTDVRHKAKAAFLSVLFGLLLVAHCYCVQERCGRRSGGGTRESRTQGPCRSLSVVSQEQELCHPGWLTAAPTAGSSRRTPEKLWTFPWLSSPIPVICFYLCISENTPRPTPGKASSSSQSFIKCPRYDPGLKAIPSPQLQTLDAQTDTSASEIKSQGRWFVLQRSRKCCTAWGGEF